MEENTKPAIQSATLWINAILPVLYLLIPELQEVLTGEYAMIILGVVNGIIRIYKTRQGIEGAI